MLRDYLKLVLLIAITAPGINKYLGTVFKDALLKGETVTATAGLLQFIL